jgi:O-Antigen ligase
MPFHYKAFILVMVITTIVFALARPVIGTLIPPGDYARRRNVWLALTAAAFMLPSFWLFIVVAAVLLAWAGLKDSNPVALYMALLLAVPPIQEYMTGLGLVKYIISFDHLRVLSLVVLLPLAARMWIRRHEEPRALAPTKALTVAHVLLFGYLLLQFGLRFPYLSVTASLRSLVETSIDVLIPYFVIVYYCRNRESLVDAMASFALTMIVLAPLALVEFAKGGLLYQGIEDRWGAASIIQYLTRGDFLRAQVTSGNSIVLGNAFAVALGFWLYLQTRIHFAPGRWLGLAAIISGLVASLARGPWVGAFVALIAYQALGPNAGRRTLKTAALLLVVVGATLASPYADKVIHFLPFVGDINSETIGYRERLAEVSLRLVQQSPFFGTPFYMADMEELRQGQGIIDIVNTYAGVALSSGLVGLALFSGFFFVMTLACIRTVRAYAPVDPDFSLLGAGLSASLIGALLIIATTSYYLSIPPILYGLAGLMAAYVRLGRNPRWAEVPEARGSVTQILEDVPRYSSR